MSAETTGNQSVERALKLLRALSTGPAELRVSDVAASAGLTLSTSSRLLATMEASGFVERNPVTGLYRLGMDVVALAGTVLNHHPVHREARQAAQNLAAGLGLGVNVAVRRGSELTYLLNFEGRDAPRASVLVGRGSPLHATGLGKCLLSALGPAERRALLPDPALVAYTARTITTHERLDEAIDRLRVVGYETEVEELALGRACIAAPIRGAAGDVVAAVSVSGPLSAISPHEREAALAAQLIETADSISVGLGFTGPAHPPVGSPAGAADAGPDDR